MTDILRDPADFREQWLAGYLAAYPDSLRRVDGAVGVTTRERPAPGRVGIVTGGGSGHYPLFAGLVGPGLVDVCAVGEVFASPAGEDVYRCTVAAENAGGVLHLICNYGGDVMNFALAAERAREDGIEVMTAIVSDDTASAPAEAREERRGIAGGLFVYKAAGAAAAAGRALADVAAAAELANAATRSFGVAFEGCTLPGNARPLTLVEEGTMEVGLGIHGEPGVSTAELMRSPSCCWRTCSPTPRLRVGRRWRCCSTDSARRPARSFSCSTASWRFASPPQGSRCTTPPSARS